MGVRIYAYAFDPEAFAAFASEALVRRETSHLLRQDLERLAHSGDLDSVLRPVTAAQRRWWIGSFVESCRDSRWYVNPADVAEASLLFARLLRGHGCGAELPSIAYGLTDVAFPLLPLEDTDFRMAAFDSGEASFLQAFIVERLHDPGRCFARPTGAVGIAPTTDPDWDLWVRETADTLAWPKLASGAFSLLTFIG